MRSASPRDPASSSSNAASDAESLFRSKRIHEIRAAEAATRREIEAKADELRHLVGRSYRDLIDSADSILLIKSSASTVSSNLSSISSLLSSLPQNLLTSHPPSSSVNPGRARLYAAAARVKYLIDTPEHIWGTLDELMLLESASRFLRARIVHSILSSPGGVLAFDVAAKFPLLLHQWQIVDAFKPQILQRCRDRLMELGLPVTAYADALASIAMIDDAFIPAAALCLFLDSRRSAVIHTVGVKFGNPTFDINACVSILCEVAGLIRATLGQVGELFVLALNEMPLFYRTALGSPPGSQLFGGIPNPEEEVRLWKEHREQLELSMALLDPEFIAKTCSEWLREVCRLIFGVLPAGKRLVDVVATGEGLGSVEKMIKKALNGREELGESLEQWLRNVFGSDIESPWNQIRGLILKEEGKDVFEDSLEEVLLKRMKEIVQAEFRNMHTEINVRALVSSFKSDEVPENNDFSVYLRRPSTGSGIWFFDSKQKNGGILAGLKPNFDESDFQSRINSYFGPEVSRIKDMVDNKCQTVLEDLLYFVESNNATLRLKVLASYLQDECYKAIMNIVRELEDELANMSTSLASHSKGSNSHLPSAVIIERSLYIGRVLYALHYQTSHLPVVLGSPRQWGKEAGGILFANVQSPLRKHFNGPFDSPLSSTPRRHTFDSPRSPGKQFNDNSRRQTIAAAAALFGLDSTSSASKLEDLNKTLHDLCIRAHTLWIKWVSGQLSCMLRQDLDKDDALSASSPMRGWEITVIKQEDRSTNGPLEMQIALPSMPSIYIISFLYQACSEIHNVGGHILNKIILQNLAWELLEQVVGTYNDFVKESDSSRISEKGILQILLDLRFVCDILSGGRDPTSHAESDVKPETSLSILRTSLRRNQLQVQHSTKSVTKLIDRLSQGLDPIDWATYESYLWDNEKQSYKRYAVLFGFFVQLNRMYTDMAQKLPTTSNTDSNIMGCSQVPRFKYLPISVPALSSKGSHKSILTTSDDASSSRSHWKSSSMADGSPKSDFDDNMPGGFATPLLKSFMTQVGSKFGESTSRWGSMLSDGQVGKLKDKSAAAMSTFGDILPGPAVGLFSSLTAGSRVD